MKELAHLRADVDDFAIDGWEEGAVAGLPRAPLGPVLILPEVALQTGMDSL